MIKTSNLIDIKNSSDLVMILPLQVNSKTDASHLHSAVTCLSNCTVKTNKHNVIYLCMIIETVARFDNKMERDRLLIFFFWFHRMSV